jgi:G:T-mismatch repair DNA endonuclease (very short patch repair protein)
MNSLVAFTMDITIKSLKENYPLDTLDSSYEQTQAKINHLKKLGYEVIEKWKCDFLDEVKASPLTLDSQAMQLIYKGSALDPRDSLYGGRTC